MMTRRTIALEGLPFVGKSSSAQAISATDVSVSVLSDYHEVADDLTRVRLAGVPTSVAEQRARVATYRRIDEERWRIASRAASKTVLFDRSLISILAYNNAIQETFAPLLWHEEPAAVDELALGSVRVPEQVIYIAIDVETAVARHEALAVRIDPLMRTSAFLGNLIRAFEVTISMHAMTRTIDGTQSIDGVIAEVRQCIYEG